MSDEQLQKDLDMLNDTLDALKPTMGIRYAEKYEERGSYKDCPLNLVLENLGRNVVQFVVQTHIGTKGSARKQAADIINLVMIVLKQTEVI